MIIYKDSIIYKSHKMTFDFRLLSNAKQLRSGGLRVGLNIFLYCEMDIALGDQRKNALVCIPKTQVVKACGIPSLVLLGSGRNVKWLGRGS